MPEHIFKHSRAVSAVSVAIASHLNSRINIVLVERAALLHDICKMDSINTGQDHARMGGRLLDILDCPELAIVVRQHVRLESDELNEAMIVNYADKRVMHEEVVSLSRRFRDLMDRYGKDENRQKRISDLFAKSLENEKIIIKATGTNLERLNDLNLMKGDDFLNTV